MKADGNASEYDSSLSFKTYELGVTWNPDASSVYGPVGWETTYIDQINIILPALGFSYTLRELSILFKTV